MALIGATPTFDELQVAWLVKSCVDPPVNIPNAENCWVVPTAAPGVAGNTSMPVRTGVPACTEMLSDP